MRARTSLLSAAVGLAVAMSLVGAAPAAAAPGPGTFTKITTPSGPTFFHFGVSTQLAVSGTTSFDVTTVDIVCVFYAADGSASSAPFATDVPVSAGTFSATASYPSSPVGSCRLRALPAGVDVTDYLGSFAGPILYTWAVLPTSNAGPTYGFTAIGEQGDGIGLVEDAGKCGVALMSTIEMPSMSVRGTGQQGCAFALPAANVSPSGTATASAIKVDGQNAYLPSGVHDVLIQQQGLSVPQNALTVSHVFAANGDLRVTESAPLVSCSGDDSYPPTAPSCPSLVNTGVTFQRVTDLFKGAHQARIRDRYTSTDGAPHTLTLQYQNLAARADTGAPGFTFPGHSATFHKATPDEVVTGLGTKAGTMFMRSDVYASSTEPSADTIGLTWSRPPTKVMFAHGTTDVYALPYSLAVPAGRAAFLGFADSERVTTAGAKAVAATAVADMVTAPGISSPAAGATVHSKKTTVKGTLTAGANGLPTKVDVNGHAATITRKSNTAATYHVTFSESFGKHTIKVTAHDVVGNTKSRSIVIRNTS